MRSSSLASAEYCAARPRRSFHSLPGYYGGYVALWCVLPALALFAIWHAVEPVVLRSADGRHLARKGYDVTVFFPHVDYRTSRPDWLQGLLDRRLVAIRLDADAERTLVRAFRPGDPPDAVAIDQMLVPAEAVSVTLAIPTGRHWLLREWPDGRQIRLGEVGVVE